MKSALLQSLVAVLYPAECVLCRVPVGTDFGLCPACLLETPFMAGPVCPTCGVPALQGDTPAEGLVCDDCIALARPWGRARAVFQYAGNARRLVLALKHGDRLDLVRACAPWMAQTARPLVQPDSVIVPVPLHPWRQFRRRYNQAAELARALARQIDRPYAPQALVRHRQTPSLDHRSRADRMAILQGAIRAHPDDLTGRHVLLVDDVMTSGATLAACADAALGAGARGVDCVVLARVLKDDPGIAARIPLSN